MTPGANVSTARDLLILAIGCSARRYVAARDRGDARAAEHEGESAAMMVALLRGLEYPDTAQVDLEDLEGP